MTKSQKNSSDGLELKWDKKQEEFIKQQKVRAAEDNEMKDAEIYLDYISQFAGKDSDRLYERPVAKQFKL